MAKYVVTRHRIPICKRLDAASRHPRMASSCVALHSCVMC